MLEQAVVADKDRDIYHIPDPRTPSCRWVGAPLTDPPPALVGPDGTSGVPFVFPSTGIPAYLPASPGPDTGGVAPVAVWLFVAPRLTPDGQADVAWQTEVATKIRSGVAITGSTPWTGVALMLAQLATRTRQRIASTVATCLHGGDVLDANQIESFWIVQPVTTPDGLALPGQVHHANPVGILRTGIDPATPAVTIAQLDLPGGVSVVATCPTDPDTLTGVQLAGVVHSFGRRLATLTALYDDGVGMYLPESTVDEMVQAVAACGPADPLPFMVAVGDALPRTTPSATPQAITRTLIDDLSDQDGFDAADPGGFYDGIDEDYATIIPLSEDDPASEDVAVWGEPLEPLKSATMEYHPDPPFTGPDGTNVPAVLVTALFPRDLTGGINVSASIPMVTNRPDGTRALAEGSFAVRAWYPTA